MIATGFPAVSVVQSYFVFSRSAPNDVATAHYFQFNLAIVVSLPFHGVVTRHFILSFESSVMCIHGIKDDLCLRGQLA